MGRIFAFWRQLRRPGDGRGRLRLTGLVIAAVLRASGAAATMRRESGGVPGESPIPCTRILRWRKRGPVALCERLSRSTPAPIAPLAGGARGYVEVIASERGKILGAAIVGPAAGELINLYTLAICREMYASDLASTAAPYPCFFEAAP